MEPEDSYLTIAAPAEAASRERSSKFLAYAYPVQQEEQIREILDGLRKKYYDATHHCYAWRLGPGGAAFRANDDGEPSGTAGKPILGQLLSNNLTDCLIVVVRYFGGTKLGGSGADRRIQGIGGGGDRGGPNRRTHRRPHDPRRFPLHRHERHHARHQGAAA